MFPFNEKQWKDVDFRVLLLWCSFDRPWRSYEFHIHLTGQLSLHFKIQFKNRNPNLRLRWLLSQHLLIYYWCSKNINIILLYYWCSKNMWGEVQEWEESRIFYILVQRATNCKPLITSNLFVQKAQNINYGMKMWTSSL